MRLVAGAALILAASHVACAETTAPAAPPDTAPSPATAAPSPSPSQTSTPPLPPPTANARETSSAQATTAGAAKLSCKTFRGDLGIFEPLRFMSLTIDVKNKYVKMVHEGDGKVFEFTDGTPNSNGNRSFVTVTDENIVYGRGREAWKIDRYTGTLTNPSIGIPFECQLRTAERKF